MALVSNAPAITFASNFAYSNYANIGMATANNNFITGAVLGDLALGAFNTNNIWFYNANTNTVRMRLDSDGGGTFSSFVSASGPKSQIRVNGNSVGCGISLTNTIVGANRRNWGIFTEQDVEGDFVIKRSNFSGSEPQSGTTIFSLSRDANATFSSSVTATSISSVFKEGFIVRATTTGGGGSQPAYTYYTAAGSKRWSSFLNVGDDKFHIANASNAELFTIQQDGNFGFGTTSPANRLHVVAGNGNQMDLDNTAQRYTQLNFKNNGTQRAFLAIDQTNSEFQIYGQSGFATTFGAGGGEKMRITSGGNVGIGTILPDAGKLVVDSASNTQIAIINTSVNTGWIGMVASDLVIAKEANNNIVFKTLSTYPSGVSTGTERMRINGNGIITINNLAAAGSRAVLADSSGNLSAPVSDISVKENITSIGYGLNEILKMNPVWFDFIDEYKNYGEGRQNGNIAQEMEAIIPEAVFTTPSTGKMGINYDQLHAIYIKAIQEQQAQIEELKQLIKNK
jgi:hypothetical protein